MNIWRSVGWVVAGGGLAAALAWALWPQPLAIDTGIVSRAPLRQSLLAEGITRVREPYLVAAPISGTLERAPVEIGDPVIRGETIVAEIRPAEPALMDARTRAQAEAAVTEARAALELSETNLRRAITSLDHAQSEQDRARALAERGTIPQRVLDDAQNAFTLAAQALAAARAERSLRAATLERALAQMLGPQDAAGAVNGGCCLRLAAPVSGVVLSLQDPSARPVQAGSQLMTLGDLSDLEIEIDLLSSDAVRVPERARVLVERWGGAGVLEAQVRRIEPAAFTRVSALGIEEQRVRVLVDFVSPPESRLGLGDRFRVFARVVLWEGEDVLQVPQAALFRDGDGWAVFRVVGGVARLTPVTLGRQSESAAQVVSGLEAGETVILFPGATLTDGAAVAPREGG